MTKKKRIKQLEAKVAKLEQRIALLEARPIVPAIYSTWPQPPLPKQPDWPQLPDSTGTPWPIWDNGTRIVCGDLNA